MRRNSLRRWSTVCGQSPETGSAFTRRRQATCKAIRLREFNNTHGIFLAIERSHQNAEGREFLNLRRDVFAGSDGRDYRGIHLFASDCLRGSGCALRVSDVIPGAPNCAPLQINVSAVQ